MALLVQNGVNSVTLKGEEKWLIQRKGNPLCHNITTRRQTKYKYNIKMKINHVPLKGEEKEINRRKGNHHPNLWTDDFIQSLSSPYGASSYRERVQTLIEEVKEIFNFCPDNFFQVLWVIDIVEKFGIDRYFHREIKAALENVYVYWNEKVSENAIGDLNTTALGFRILRQNGYAVFPDVFQIFKNAEGQFLFPESTHQDAQLRSMMNLYRASELSFKGEKILKDAEMFAYQFLVEAREEGNKLNKRSQLLHEVEYILKYPWKCRTPRWEARSSIVIYSLDDSWMMMKKRTACKNIIELAVLDFNILQAYHQTELKFISRWWNNSKVKALNFFRQRHVEFFFWWIGGLFEPEFSKSRIGVTKLSALITLLDDIYDKHGTLDELKPFTTALIKWDNLIVGGLPNYMKITFEFAQETLDEIAIEAERNHGPRVHKYMQKYWESYILSYLKEAEWIATNNIPTFDEYMKNGATSVAVPMVTIYSLILIDKFIPEDILLKIGKIETLVSCCSRLLDDSRDYEDEKLHGENASCIECYVKDNPGSKREDALNHINTLFDNTIEELKQEIFSQKDIPSFYKKVCFDTLLKGFCFIFKDVDGLSNSHKETKNAIMKIFVEPIYM